MELCSILLRGTLDVQQMIKSCRNLYNLTASTALVKDQCPIGERFYGEGDVLTLPLWYSKKLFNDKMADVKEIQDFGDHFNSVISNQFINRKELVKIDRDFYFMAIDYLYMYITKRGRRNAKKEQFVKFYELRKNIIIGLLSMGYNSKVIPNMAFIERVTYVSMVKQMKQLDRYVSPLTSIDTEDEE